MKLKIFFGSLLCVEGHKQLISCFRGMIEQNHIIKPCDINSLVSLSVCSRCATFKYCSIF